MQLMDGLPNRPPKWWICKQKKNDTFSFASSVWQEPINQHLHKQVYETIMLSIRGIMHCRPMLLRASAYRAYCFGSLALRRAKISVFRPKSRRKKLRAMNIMIKGCSCIHVINERASMLFSRPECLRSETIL